MSLPPELTERFRVNPHTQLLTAFRALPFSADPLERLAQLAALEQAYAEEAHEAMVDCRVSSDERDTGEPTSWARIEKAAGHRVPTWARRQIDAAAGRGGTP